MLAQRSAHRPAQAAPPYRRVAQLVATAAGVHPWRRFAAALALLGLAALAISAMRAAAPPRDVSWVSGAAAAVAGPAPGGGECPWLTAAETAEGGRTCLEAFAAHRARRRRELLERGGAAPPGAEPSVDEPVVVADWKMGPGSSIGSGSVVRAPDGLLLASLDRWQHRGGTDIYSSADDGASWRHVHREEGLKWATLVRDGARVFAFGVPEYFWFTAGRVNPLSVSVMRPGSGGAEWSPPAPVTPGLRVHVTNGGVTVSRGEVLATFTHDSSVLGARARLALPLAVEAADLDARVLEAEVGSAAEAASLPLHALVGLTRAAAETRADMLAAPEVLFLRVVGRRDAGRVVLLRPERWSEARMLGPAATDKIWYPLPVNRPERGPWRFPAGSALAPLMVTFGDMQWGMARARAGADLTDPASWRLADGSMGNPAMASPRAWREMLGVRPLLERDADGRPAGCGLGVGLGECPYWQESVVVRNEHRDPTTATVALRLTNEDVCDLAMMVDVRLLAGGALAGEFRRAGRVPGMSVVRSHFVWDEASQLYWLVGNVAPAVDAGAPRPGHWPRCTWDRSALVLHYSADLSGWLEAGPVAVGVAPGRHFSYAHVAVDGDDLVVVSHSAPDGLERPGAKYDPLRLAHNSPYLTFHRVRNFRAYARASLVYREPVRPE